MGSRVWRIYLLRSGRPTPRGPCHDRCWRTAWLQAVWNQSMLSSGPQSARFAPACRSAHFAVCSAPQTYRGPCDDIWKSGADQNASQRVQGALVQCWNNTKKWYTNYSTNIHIDIWHYNKKKIWSLSHFWIVPMRLLVRHAKRLDMMANSCYRLDIVWCLKIAALNQDHDSCAQFVWPPRV